MTEDTWGQCPQCQSTCFYLNMARFGEVVRLSLSCTRCRLRVVYREVPAGPMHPRPEDGEAEGLCGRCRFNHMAVHPRPRPAGGLEYRLHCEHCGTLVAGLTAPPGAIPDTLDRAGTARPVTVH